MGNRREFPFGLIDKLKINKIYYVRKKNYLPVPDRMSMRLRKTSVSLLQVILKAQYMATLVGQKQILRHGI